MQPSVFPHKHLRWVKVQHGPSVWVTESHGIVMLKYDLSVTKFSFDAELGKNIVVQIWNLSREDWFKDFDKLLSC